MLFMSSCQTAVMTDGGESGPLRSGDEQPVQLTAKSFSSSHTSPQQYTHVTDLHKCGGLICHMLLSQRLPQCEFFIIQSSQEALSDRYRSGYTFIPVGVMCHLDTIQLQWAHKQHDKMERKNTKSWHKQRLNKYRCRRCIKLFSNKCGGMPK